MPYQYMRHRCMEHLTLKRVHFRCTKLLQDVAAIASVLILQSQISFSEYWMPLLASPSTRASTTTASLIFNTRSFTDWVFLRECSSSSEQPSTGVCNPQLHGTVPDGILPSALWHYLSAAPAICQQLFVYLATGVRCSVVGPSLWLTRWPGTC